MLDVAAVAQELLVAGLPPATLERLVQPLMTESDRGARWIAAFVALDDLGKASPAFQKKSPEMAALLAASGFDLNPPLGPRDDGSIGLVFVTEALVRVGLDRWSVLRAARSVAGHHGTLPSDEALDEPGRRESGAAPVWRIAREAISLEIIEAFGLSGYKLLTIPDRDHGWFLLLAGLTSVAEWIGSMANVFGYSLPAANSGAYLLIARESARRAIQTIGMRSPTAPARRSFTELFGADPWPLHTVTEQLAGQMESPGRRPPWEKGRPKPPWWRPTCWPPPTDTQSYSSVYRNPTMRRDRGQPFSLGLGALRRGSVVRRSG